MTFTSNYIRTENDSRLRSAAAPRVAYRQLEASIGTLVVLLMFGMAVMISQQISSKAAQQVAVTEAPRQAKIVSASVRVIPMYAPQAAALVQTDRGL